MRVSTAALAVASFVVASAGLVGASNFWDAKPYTEWSPKEMETILTDSPWVRKLSVVVQSPPRATDDGGGGGGGRGGGGGGDVGGRGFPVPAPQLKLTLTWRSALPVREALSRSGDTVAPGGQSMLDPPQHYLLTLSGVPARYQRLVPSAATTSFLKRGTKPPIALLQGGIQQDSGGLLTLIFAFPRTDPIVLDDKEVEFVTAIGTLEIKHKFKLKDLLVNGQLEL